MKRIIIKCCICGIALLVLYEITFRIATGIWGEVDTNSRPIKLYYSCMFPPFWEKCGRFLEIVFYPRIKIPLGMIRLARGTGAYVYGGTIYRKSADNKLENMTLFFEKNISVQSNNPSNGK